MVDIIWIIVIAICAGLIPGLVGRGMGRSFLQWWVYGTFLFPVALVHVIILRAREGSRYCPYCHTRVRYTSPYCTKCGYEFIEF
ncbi:MAG: hypothetical protein ACE5GY_01435 [Thermodesulfobacteriota bacterium]